jgi:hypothetical protein
MPSAECRPGSLKEALVFAAGSMLVGLAPMLYVMPFSIPPAHRDPIRTRVEVTVALGLVVAVSLIGALAFSLAQAWRRRQDVLFPRSLRPWLPLGLGACYPVSFFAGLYFLTWLSGLDETMLGWILGLGLPVVFSRLAWRLEERPAPLWP